MVERMPQVGQRGEVHTGLLCGNMTEEEDFEDLGVNCMMILREILSQ